MDFNTFVISGPATTTNSQVKIINGQPAKSGVPAFVQTCLTDSFTVTNVVGGTNVPVICGVNSGEHCNLLKIICILNYTLLKALFHLVYVDVNSENCNDLTFQLGNIAVGTAAPANNQWSIKVQRIL